MEAYQHRAMRWRLTFGKLNVATDWSATEVDRLKKALHEDDMGSVVPVIDALVDAYHTDEGDQDADNVRACLLACQEAGWTRWSTDQFVEMMSGLVSWYDSWESAIDTWLAKAGPTLKVEWLRTEHEGLRKAIQQDRHIWVQRPTGEGRVYVFTRP